jgi:hypothetical protein
MYHVSAGCRVTPDVLGEAAQSSEWNTSPRSLSTSSDVQQVRPSTYHISRNPTSVYVLSVPLQHRGLRMQPGTPFTSCAWKGSAYCMYHIDEYLSWRRWWYWGLLRGRQQAGNSLVACHTHVPVRNNSAKASRFAQKPFAWSKQHRHPCDISNSASSCNLFN